MDINLLYLVIAFTVGLFLGWILWRYLEQNPHGEPGIHVWQNPACLRGLDHIITGKHDLAAEEFSTLIRQYPNLAGIYLILGNLFREQGESERAIWIHQSLIVRPGLPEEFHLQAMLALGLDYQKAGVIDRAILTFRQIISRYPEHIPAHQHLEQLYEQESNWSQAYLTQQRLINLTRSQDKRQLAHLQVQMAKAYQAQNDLAEAGKRLHTALYLEPKSSEARLYLGDIYLAQGDTAKAIAVWEEMVKRQLDYACMAYKRLSEAYWNSGSYERLEQLYTEALAKVPEDLRTRIALADYYARQGKTDQAMAQIRQGLTFHPQNHYLREKLLRIMSQTAGLPFQTDLVQALAAFPPEEIPFICTNCGYETTDNPWECPNCRHWDTFAG